MRRRSVNTRSGRFDDEIEVFPHRGIGQLVRQEAVHHWSRVICWHAPSR
jgi:hypothetical protein